MKRCPVCKHVKPLSEYYARRARGPSATSPRCKDCDKARVKRRYDLNPEAARERGRSSSREYRRKNRERISAARKERYHSDPDFREAHKKKLRERYRRDPAKHIADTAKWAAENRAKARAIKGRYSASARGRAVARHNRALRRARLAAQTSRCTIEERALIFERADGVCEYCNKPGALTLDHIVALARGGSDTADNLAAVCESCNYSKAAHHPVVWSRRKLGYVPPVVAASLKLVA